MFLTQAGLFTWLKVLLTFVILHSTKETDSTSRCYLPDQIPCFATAYLQTQRLKHAITKLHYFYTGVKSAILEEYGLRISER